jgi:hypothetical protein
MAFPQLMRARSGQRRSLLLFVAFVRPHLPHADIVVDGVTYLPQNREQTTNIGTRSSQRRSPASSAGRRRAHWAIGGFCNVADRCLSGRRIASGGGLFVMRKKLSKATRPTILKDRRNATRYMPCSPSFVTVNR